MSKTVDSRVLEMRFDNKQFEANVATSMSTLDKLKQKLKFTESSKNLTEIGKASKNLDFSSAINGVAALEKRFSIMGIAGMTVIQNLTTSAMHLGSRLTSWFTGGIVQGGITRAMNLEKARFQLQGLLKDTEKVEAVMENVNASVDGTAYSLDQAAVVASMFAATGMEAGEKMEGALRAVAGTAAMTSADYQRVGLIFTQISGQGRVMGNDLLQLSNLGINAAATLAKHFGKTEAEIRDLVSKGEISFEMFAEAMDDAFGAHAAKANATFTGAMANVKAALARIGAEFISPLVVENGPLVKFFNTLRERINEVKASIGPLASTFTDFVSKIANGATKLLSKMDFSKPFKKFEGLNIGFDKLVKSVNKILAPVKEVRDDIEKVGAVSDKVTESLEDLGSVVDDVILGKFGNGQERFDKLTESGYNWCEVQNKVNEKLGDSKRYTEEQIKAQDKLLTSQKKTAKSQKETAKATAEATDETGKLTKEQKNQLKSLVRMSEEQAKSKGYTEEQIAALQELVDTAEKLGMPIDEFIDNLDEINGKFLLIRSFSNIAKSIGTVFKSLGSAFRDVFDPIKPQQLFDAIVGFHKLTAAMVPSEQTAEKLTRTFRGLFAALDLVTTIFGGAFKIAFTVITSVLEGLGVGVLDVTATVGDMIYKFNEWFQDNVFAKFIEKIVEKIPIIIDGIKEFVSSLNIGEGAANAFKTVCEGVGAAVDIIYGSISRSLTTGLKIAGAVLSLFGTNLGEVATKIAECVIKFRDWIKENTIFVDAANKIAEIIAKVIEAIGKLAKQFMALKPVQQFIERFKDTITGFFKNFSFSFDGGFLDNISNAISNITDKISEFLKSLENSEHFGLDLVKGLANGIKNGIGMVVSAIANIANTIISTICGILGIHSPSTVMMAIGSYLILGLLLGMKNVFPEAFGVISELFTNLLSIIKDVISDFLPGIWGVIKTVGSKLKVAFDQLELDIGSLFVGGVIIASLLLLRKALKIAETLAKPIEGFSKLLTSMTGAFNKLGDLLKAKKWEVYANAVKGFATSILILAGAIYILANIDAADLFKAGVMLVVLAGVIAGLMLVANKMDNIKDLSFVKLGAMLVGLGVTLLIMAKAMKIISGLNPDQLTVTLSALVIMIGALGMVIAAFGKFVEADNAENMNKAGTMLLKMAIAIGILALVMKLISGMSWPDIEKGLQVIIELEIMFGALMLLSDYAGDNALKAGGMFLMMAVAIGILVMVIKLIASISDGDIEKGLQVIIELEIMFGALMVLSYFAGVNAAKAGGMFLMMSIAIAILAMTIKSIADIPDDDIAKSMSVITNIMLLFMSVMLLSNFVGDNALKAGGMFLMMSSAILILGISIKLLAGIPEADITKAFGVIMSIEILFMALMILSEKVGENADKAGSMFLKMSAAILIIAVAIALLAMLDPADVIRGTLCITLLLGMFAAIMYVSQYVTGAHKTILMMAICIGLLAGSIVALSFLDPSKVVTATVCISAVLGMFALVEKASANVTKSMSTLIVLTLAIGMISGCLYLLAQLPIDQSLGAAKSLSIVLLAMSAALLVLSNVHAISPMAIVALAAMTIAMGLIGVVLGLLQHFNVQPSIETAVALSTLLLAMSAACLILAAVGVTGPAALIGIGILSALIVAIGGLMVAIGALMQYVPQLETFLDKGISVLMKIGEAIGGFFGSMVDGFVSQASESLPLLGARLGAFMIGAQPFFDGLSNMDSSVAESAKNLALAILAITGADLLDSLTSWLTGGVDMDAFGEKLVALGSAMKGYANEVTGIDTEAITASAAAAKSLVGVLDALPEEGGLWQKLAGQKDMASFATQLTVFGKAMKSYGESVAGIDTESITASASAAKALTEVADKAPTVGGAWQLLAGSKDIADFGKKLIVFGAAMKSYASQVAGIDTESITASASAAEALTEVANKVPTVGGLKKFFAGTKNLGDFGEKLVAFGEGMKDYASSVSGIDTESIVASASAAEKLTTIIENMDGIDTDGVSDFKKAIDKLADVDMDGVAEAFSGVSKTAKLVSAGVKMIKSVGKGIKSGQSSVTSAAKSAASAAVNAISANTSKFKTAGTNMVKAFSGGIKSKNDSVEKAGKTLAAKAVSGAKNKKDSMKSAGRNLGEGLVEGINAKQTAVYNAAFKLGQKAVQGEKDGQNSNSPSKETIKAGKWLGEGLVIGMKRMETTVYKAGHSMGETSVNSISKVVSKISSLIDSDIDVQPTIAPVMDLTDIESGVGAINGMLGNTFGIGATANLNAINTMMNRRNQNGANSELVSAIDKLRKDVQGIEASNYSINGITYSNGSDIQDAVQTLVRAAKMERRV